MCEGGNTFFSLIKTTIVMISEVFKTIVLISENEVLPG